MSTKIKFKQIAFPSNNKTFIKGDGTFDLNNYAILDENNKIPLDNIPDSIILNACYYEDFINADYTPKLGETIIVIDYIKVNDRNVPSFVIGDGITLLGELIPSGNFAKCSEIAKKLEHKLIIGEFEFDGSEDVIIPIYDGEINK